ncbi:MAG: T9SS type A sorting domain-containing protein [Crocinitomix sp.]|nr:T9SS type A sorting domain-containing protein [Crocinitomix sp.]
MVHFNTLQMKLLLSTTLMIVCAIGFSQTFTEIFKAAGFDRESEDRMGYSLDISGDYAIIGAYGDDFGATNPNMGSAYIFEKTGIEDWEFVQKINNSDQDDYDRFGYSVAINGNYAVIGAYGEDHDTDDGASMSKAGSAYIFERGIDGTWTEMQKIVASDRIADAEFGWSVDIYETTVIIGAHHEGYDEAGLDFEYHAGAVYTYTLDGGIWSETQKLVPSDRSDDHVYPSGRPDPTDEDFSDLFGGSVAIWGDYLIAGCHMHDYGAGGVGTGYSWNAGTAYIFERTGDTWTEVEKLLPAIRNPYDRFGYAVDIDSSIIVIGVYSEDESEFEGASLMNAGGAYIFERDGGGDWSQIQKLDASDRTAGDHFGKDVAIDDSYLVIGAEHEDEFLGDGSPGDELIHSGAAYIFEKDVDGVWSEIQKIANSDRNIEDLFGEAVAISENTIFVGAWQQDLDSAGAAYAEDAGAGYFYSAVVCEEETSEQDITVCYGETYEIGDNIYDATGTYTDTLLNIDACDSIVTTTLVVNDSISESQTIELCFGETYTIGGSTYDMTGSYVDTLSTIEGCDSIVHTELFIEEENVFEQEMTICAGESVSVGASTYDETGSYEDVLVSATLCDSTVLTTLTVLPAIDVSISMVDELTLTGGDPGVETTTFQWIKCDPFEVIDGATEDTYTATENGSYAIVITDGDCVDTSACMDINSVGINSYLQDLVAIYPNPTTGQFIVDAGGWANTNFTITITNQVGELVYHLSTSKSKTNIDLSHLSSGIYIIKLIDGERTILKKLSKL